MPQTKPPTKNRPIKLSLRDFALPSPRQGSIDLNSGYGPVPDRGLELHQKIQQQTCAETANYKPEVATNASFVHDGFQIKVSGRVDGVYMGQTTLIEEIKSSYDIADLKAQLGCFNHHPYLLQLRSYGYFHWLKTSEEPQLRLLIICARTESREQLSVDLDRCDYEAWLTRRLAELVAEEKLFTKIRKRRKRLGKTLPFPFTQARPGQKELIETIEASFKEATHLMLQAPTGLGKTAGVIYPVAREALLGSHQLIYATPKNSQQHVAEEAVARFQSLGLPVRSLTVTAKAKICMKDEALCNAQYCEFAKDYYGKTTRHDVIGQLRKLKTVDAKVLRTLAQRYEVCPFQLSIDLAKFSDIVICDYNYIIAPSTGLCHSLTESRAPSNTPSLVIDEAHNLPTRATDYYSSELSESVLEHFIPRFEALLANRSAPALQLLEDTIKTLRSLGRQTAKALVGAQDLLPLIELDDRVKEFLGHYLASTTSLSQADPVLEFAFYMGACREAVENLGENFFVTCEHSHDKVRLRISCCDASSFLREAWQRFRKIVSFSATIKPFKYYAQLSGFDLASLKTAEFSSPFPRDRRKILIIPQVSTDLKSRQGNYGKIADAIARIVKLHPGNYAVFFPSYSFLQAVATKLEEQMLDTVGFETKVQTGGMRKDDIGRWLRQLSDGAKPTLLLAVQGGAFAEGVDYKGSMLIGAFIVGPALPTFDLERRLLARYYDTHYGEGSDYAFTYPAMAKAVQAAGRVIRSPEDKGLIVLMDRRFTEPRYTKVMPTDWYEAEANELVSTSILRDIEDFWNGDDSLATAQCAQPTAASLAESVANWTSKELS